MGEIAIRVEGLSKQYRIGGKQERYRTLRDTLADAAVAPFRRVRSILRGHGAGLADSDSTIWALKDVSFTVSRGDTLGIVGRNGAGKSTLLKILSRITEPTEGYAEVHGRVGSLLEVGTGFHPELTGRENIYLNGAILGMKRAEIERKFDEIVAFAEVEQFIDTPVKHYSSGMYLRLAFAVAAHLEPEILLVDEVLAVGDADFQKKCLGKMDEVAKAGRTVVFVSHDLAAIENLCHSAMYIHRGRVCAMGEASMVVRGYVQSGARNRPVPLCDRLDRTGKGPLRFYSIVLEGTSLVGEPNRILTGGALRIRLELRAQSPEAWPARPVNLAVLIRNSKNQILTTFATFFTRRGMLPRPVNGCWGVLCDVEELPLLEDEYYIDLWCAQDQVLLDYVSMAHKFVVVGSKFRFTSDRVKPVVRKHGPVYLTHSWSECA